MTGCFNLRAGYIPYEVALSWKLSTLSLEFFMCSMYMAYIPYYGPEV